MMKPAERVSERMHAGDRGIREGETRKMRAKQHRRARFEIAGLLDGGEQVCAQQPKRFAGQRIGQRVLEPRRGIGFDRMDDRVDPGRGGDMARKPKRQGRIEHRPVGDQRRLN